MIQVLAVIVVILSVAVWGYVLGNAIADYRRKGDDVQSVLDNLVKLTDEGLIGWDCNDDGNIQEAQLMDRTVVILKARSLHGYSGALQIKVLRGDAYLTSSYQITDKDHGRLNRAIIRNEKAAPLRLLKSQTDFMLLSVVNGTDPLKGIGDD